MRLGGCIVGRRAPRRGPRHEPARRLPDNSAVESCFASLKDEGVYRNTYANRDAARADIFDYIEAFYNSRRRHSTLGQISPMEFEPTYAR